jgi:NADH:ubiquinone reductase (H+-translocating)
MNVLVLGAGYGGLFAAASLLRDDKCRVTLVDKEPHNQLLQQIHYIVSGIKSEDDVIVPVKQLFERQERDKIKFLKATVEEVNLEEKNVKVDVSGKKQHVQYDYLVISLGAETNYFGLPGTQEHALPFRSVHDALKIRDKVHELGTDSIVTVVGGGPTGVSLAAALAISADMQKNRTMVRIVESGKEILSDWDKTLARTATLALESLGVEIIVNTRLVELKQNSVLTKSGEELASDCTVWTAGVRGRPLRITPEVKRTRSERIVVDKYCRIPGFDNAFAIGDISALNPSPNDENGSVLPQLAQIAVREARFVADNIIRTMKGQGLDKMFGFHQRGHTIALGNENISLLSGLLVTGDMCNYTEDTIVDNFLTEIKNRKRGISADVLKAAASLGGEEHKFDFVEYANSRAFRDLVS